MEKILLTQFMAHIIADFFAQPEYFSRKKQNGNLRSWHIYCHVLIVFTTSLGMIFTCGFIGYALAIAIIHFGIDILKSTIERRIKEKKRINDEQLYTNHYLFFADQIVHFFVIYVAVAVYCSRDGYVPNYLNLFTTHQLLTATGLLLCMKPTNILIRNCLSSLNLYDKMGADKNDLERAGRWIGTIERIITLVLVMLQQYTAIGFIITAKSVLRYNDSKAGKTEYVLIGTLLSFGIALLMGIGIEKGFFESFLSYIF
ncbi:DUF3307 domain-containing protein [Parabacteroides sp. PF5-6]|uniref:DUF3307 domain-containing protein n=1 Tax=Parabacteroides sp. PF5-6 TaxID=1742403 RepID=UPI002406212A|nr:DUF3307 domain-containing protein [Parabacteroides sp. PF5-6]MDF9829156.1 divalent metal cation (Fe/Co/Zn/Cd) transporter [Parabacteroides sp. PF5-6]